MFQLQGVFMSISISTVKLKTFSTGFCNILTGISIRAAVVH